MSVAVTPELLRHLEACKLNEKRYRKLVKILNGIRDKTDNAAELLEKFANKCYNKEEDRSLAKNQAQTFLEALFGSVDDITSLGTKKAMEVMLSRVYSDVDGNGRKEIDVIELDRSKSVDFNIFEHGTDDITNVEQSKMWTRKLGRYLIGPTLGVGGTAKVKLGWDTKNKCEVAMKILQPKYAFSAQKEINVLKKLNHDNIIRVYDCFDNVRWKGKKTTIFVIEYANEGELIEYLMYTSKFEEQLARWFFEKLVEGMEYCHNMNVIHRDLKHDNCLLGQGFTLKITDFGFARYYYADKGMKMKTAIGTAQYAAPEILRGDPYTESVDIFSMGVMLFIALAGSQPWRRADPKNDKWYRMIYEDNWKGFWKYHTRTHTFSDEAMRLLQGLLCHDPDKRITINEIKRDQWYKGLKYTQKKAMTELKRRKLDMDHKKFKENNASAKKTRKAIFAKCNPEKYWSQNPGGLWFPTDESAAFMLEEIKDAILAKKGTIGDVDDEKFQLNFQMKLRDSHGEKVSVTGFVKIWQMPSKIKLKKSRNLVVFKRTNACSAMLFPVVYKDLLSEFGSFIATTLPEPADDDEKEE